jgi:hypothetical protein
MHYGIPALWNLGVIGRQRRVQRRPTRRAAAARVVDAVDADGAKHGVNVIAEASRWAFVVRALRTDASMHEHAMSRRRRVGAALN